MLAFADEVTTALESGPGAVAVHTSAVPVDVLARRTSVQLNPPPDTVTSCGFDGGPSDATNATSSSLVPVVVIGGLLICAVVPSTDRFASMRGDPAGGPAETIRLTALPNAICVAAAGLWVITAPAGIDVLDVGVTVPSVRPAA